MSSQNPPVDGAAPGQVTEALAAGRGALARGDWESAYQAFENVLRLEDRPDALEGLGLAAWWLDLADVVFDARERAYRGYRERGDSLGAARLAVWLAWDTAAFRGEQAVANGWLQRARRILDGLPDAPEHAWLASRAGIWALLDDGDPHEAAKLAAEAVRVGQATGAVDYEMVGRAVHGFARVTAGAVVEGLQELDEVNAAVLAGEMSDRVLIGLACCYLIAACERVHDYERATQWCDRLKAFCKKVGFRPLFAVCRTQYASVCMWRGAWDEAELELTSAADELLACRPAMTGEGLVRLGELRRRQGKLDEAMALFDRVASHPLASVGRANVMFDRGDHAGSAELAERHLRRLPASNRTERIAALEVKVRACVEQGHLDEARPAVAELRTIADESQTAPLRARASFAAGLVSARAGDANVARTHLEDAVDLFSASGAPFETGRARVELARVLGTLGRSDAAAAEAQRAIGDLTPLGASLDLARARAVLEGAAAPPVHGGEDRKGLTPREVEVLRLISDGLNNQAIAERLFISEHTVHRHVANTLTKLNVSSRSAAVAQAGRLGLLNPKA
ncbi:MAG TPA: response regulator transcription factor [Vicinamibacterales bacterium]|nr:response regulator transcription factor [Vicinamibacterales bacterium]